jgi:restriction system protein
LFSLGSAISIFAPKRNNAIARLEELLKSGVDPGSAGPSPPSDIPSGDDEVDNPEPAADIEEVATDQITARVHEEFAGHGLSNLIAAILTAEGFVCDESPPGPDGGIDILAGRGPLGMDDPRLVVQVKSGGQIGAPVVSQLLGVMTTHSANQALLVAWGGLTKQAREALRNQPHRIRVWHASDVVGALQRNYDRLPETIRNSVPLKRVWVLDSGS